MQNRFSVTGSNTTAAALAPSPSAAANLSLVQTVNGPVSASPISSPFIAGDALQSYKNVTFNYTQCYSNAPSIRVVIQSQTVSISISFSCPCVHLLYTACDA